MNETTMLQKAVGAIIMADNIQFEPFSWSFGCVDSVIKNTVFTNPEFTISVAEDDWNNGPAASVAACLTDLLLSQKIEFRPIEEKQ